MTEHKPQSILFLGKKHDAHCLRALDFLRNHHLDIRSYFSSPGNLIPEGLLWWRGDYIISYLSSWIIPQSLIERATIAAINFHPAPPEYPGSGCTNFALYDRVNQYGVTCHYMKAIPDTGAIIKVKRFALFSSDNVHSLLIRSYDFQLVLFYEIAELVIRGEHLVPSGEEWKRKPLTINELNKLLVIDQTISVEELTRRIRATSYGKYQPTIKIGEHVFKYEVEKEEE